MAPIAEESLQSALLAMVRMMVPDDQGVTVSYDRPEGDAERIIYTVRCNPADARFIIGKQGVNASAVKAFARAAGQKLGIKAEAIIDVPELPGKTNTQ